MECGYLCTRWRWQNYHAFFIKSFSHSINNNTERDGGGGGTSSHYDSHGMNHPQRSCLKMDREGADYRRAMDTVKLKLGESNPIVLQHHLFRRGSSKTFLVMKGSSKRLLIIF